MGGRSVGAIIVYVLVTLAAIWLIVSPILSAGVLKLGGERKERETPEASKNHG